MNRLATTLPLTLAAPAFGGGPDSLEALGEALFHDLNLSANRTQTCATCHNPEFAFVDRRETEAGLAESLGDDGESLGDCNTPTAAYAMFSPPFEVLDDKRVDALVAFLKTLADARCEDRIEDLRAGPASTDRPEVADAAMNCGTT